MEVYRTSRAWFISLGISTLATGSLDELKGRLLSKERKDHLECVISARLVVLSILFAIEFSICAQQNKTKITKERNGGTQFFLVPLNGGGQVTYRMGRFVVKLITCGWWQMVVGEPTLLGCGNHVQASVRCNRSFTTTTALTYIVVKLWGGGPNGSRRRPLCLGLSLTWLIQPNHTWVVHGAREWWIFKTCPIFED